MFISSSVNAPGRPPVCQAIIPGIRPAKLVVKSLLEDFKSIGCEIYSVSCDSHFVHKAWHDASKTIQNIKYPMLADPTGALARDFDVMIESEGMAERGSFIVNPEGRIVAYEVIAGNVGRNADELFRRVQASQFVASHDDQVCPAKWRPGAETLKPSLDLVGLL